MRLAYITAGAGGMYCGSCMRDNTLVSALNRLGHDALLIPTYTPIRTDEDDASAAQPVHLGGVNVFLQNVSRVFRYTPRWLDRWLDGKRLLRFASKFAVKTRGEDLGGLTISVLKGGDGFQRKEVRRLAKHLAEDVKPTHVMLSNLLISGLAGPIRAATGAPIFGVLQGDDIFLEMLPADERRACIELIRRNCSAVDGFVVTCQYYADFMSGYLGLPREKMRVVYPGIRFDPLPETPQRDPAAPVTIGYFARIDPAKGLHRLVDGYIEMRKDTSLPPTRLKIAGWLGAHRKAFLDEQLQRVNAAGLGGEVERVDCPTKREKVEFLRGLDLMSVPTEYREPKGLYVLEAWANGVPVVQPAHGSFPELIGHTGGGLLVEPGSAKALAEGLARLVRDPAERAKLGAAGRRGVEELFTAERMAINTLEAIRSHD